MFTAICEGFSATGETKKAAVDGVLPAAIGKRHGGWGQEVVASEKIASYYSKPGSNIRSNLRRNITYNAYTNQYDIEMLLPAEDYAISLEFKNPSPLEAHQEIEPIVKQFLTVSVFDHA
jgi:hypothetical protein